MSGPDVTGAPFPGDPGYRPYGATGSDGPPSGGAHRAASDSTPLGAPGGTRAGAPGGTGGAGPAGHDDRSVGEIFAEVTGDLSTLLRQEVELAKAEVRRSAKRAGAGVGMLAGAGVAAQLVLLFLSVALWWALGDVMGLGWSALVVAALWAVVAAVLLAVGRRRLQEVEGVPETVDTVKKIPQAVRGHEERNR